MDEIAKTKDNPDAKELAFVIIRKLKIMLLILRNVQSD